MGFSQVLGAHEVLRCLRFSVFIRSSGVVNVKPLGLVGLRGSGSLNFRSRRCVAKRDFRWVLQEFYVEML